MDCGNFNNVKATGDKYYKNMIWMLTSICSRKIFKHFAAHLTMPAWQCVTTSNNVA